MLQLVVVMRKVHLKSQLTGSASHRQAEHVEHVLELFIESLHLYFSSARLSLQTKTSTQNQYFRLKRVRHRHANDSTRRRLT